MCSDALSIADPHTLGFSEGFVGLRDVVARRVCVMVGQAESTAQVDCHSETELNALLTAMCAWAA